MQKTEENKIKLTLLLPTFNEKENVQPLISKLEDIFRGKNKGLEVLFIDDSNDDTPEAIKRVASKSFLDIRMIHRPKEQRTGLATAFVVGFKEARGSYICCMDSDLQHPPRVIVELYKKALDEESDIAVASRYIPGGSAQGLGGLYRRAVSIGLKMLMHILFIPTRKTTDPGSGFFMFKKNIIEGVNLDPKGFKILIEIMMRAKYEKVSEVAYRFLPRENEESKAEFKQGIAWFKQIWLIIKTVPQARTFLKFGVVGTLGVFVNLSLLFFLVEVYRFPMLSSWLVAVVITLFFNYFLNVFFTYADKKMAKADKSVKRVKYYYLLYIPSLVVNFLIYYLLLEAGLHYFVSALIGIIISVLVNFMLTIKFIWKNV